MNVNRKCTQKTFFGGAEGGMARKIRCEWVVISDFPFFVTYQLNGRSSYQLQYMLARTMPALNVSNDGALPFYFRYSIRLCDTTIPFDNNSAAIMDAQLFFCPNYKSLQGYKYDFSMFFFCFSMPFRMFFF